LDTAVRGRSPPAGMADDAQSQAGRPKAQSSIERGKGVRMHGAFFVREQVVSRGGENISDTHENGRTGVRRSENEADHEGGREVESRDVIHLSMSPSICC
jgi:hypothetical protein